MPLSTYTLADLYVREALLRIRYLTLSLGSLIFLFFLFHIEILQTISLQMGLPYVITQTPLDLFSWEIYGMSALMVSYLVYGILFTYVCIVKPLITSLQYLHRLANLVTVLILYSTGCYLGFQIQGGTPALVILFEPALGSVSRLGFYFILSSSCLVVTFFVILTFKSWAQNKLVLVCSLKVILLCSLFLYPLTLNAVLLFLISCILVDFCLFLVFRYLQGHF